MQADFSVELGSNDPALEFPWSSADPNVRYYDLKNHPELVHQIPEVKARPELGSFLSRINAAGFPLATAKCDSWSTTDVAPEEELFGDRKFVSYVDLVFVDEANRCSLERHLEFAQDLCRLLGHSPEIAAAVEFVIRRCYYSREMLPCQDESAPPSQRNVKPEAGVVFPSSGSGNENWMDLTVSELPSSQARTLGLSIPLNQLDPYQSIRLDTAFTSTEKPELQNKSESKDKIQMKRNVEVQDKGHSQMEIGSEDKPESQNEPHATSEIRAEHKDQSEEKICSRHELRSNVESLKKNRISVEHKVQSEDTTRSPNQLPLEDELASVAGFCLTAYVTGFGDKDNDPALRWTIGLNLLQYALVQEANH
ncbi:MAG: hypothetical protein JWN42_1031 [Candidatus Angelobacter sp.]|nr:hypothetical protein [Candidatus Angelobacter sp.]